MDAREMIESISLKNIATYSPDTPENLTELKAVNVIYGANGAGKTTISRLIADPGISADCTVRWKNNIPVPALVYNSDFIADNYSDSKNLKGVFTLGKTEQSQKDRLEQLKVDCKRFEQQRDRTLLQLNGEDGTSGKHAERRELDARLVSRCWDQKIKHDETFQGAFKGVRSSRDSFKARVLQENLNNKASLLKLEELTDKALVLYGDAPSALVAVPNIDLTSLITLQSDRILAKKIVGKGDVDVAALIERLGNSDWVRQGIKFLEHSDDHCPFCQQAVSHDFESHLSQYFDETFETDVRALKEFSELYFSRANDLIARAQILLDNDYQHLDKEVLGLEVKALEALIKVNVERIVNKMASPSLAVELESLSDLGDKLAKLIADANKKISEHNRLVAGFSTEQSNLTSEVWKYLLETELKQTLSEYTADTGRLDKAIEGLTKTLDKAKGDILQANADIATIEASLTSVQPTVKAINELLRDFGFRGFSLAVAPGENSYKLLRSDGTDARKTLSEGEKTFVTFLYFYHLLKGSTTTTGVTSERIVVIDDPVSSLDSDVLFIVSSLIKQIFTEVRQANNVIRQIFVLTHNVHFHKEITFSPLRRGTKAWGDETFWVVRKPDHHTKVEGHAHNPVKTSYQLLWGELRKNPLPTLTLQNTMRRILENYFKILGGIDTDKLLEQFDGHEKVQCQSLISWINDGSHYSPDDLFVAIGDKMATSYMRIFFKIFKAANHLAHYEMMMGEDYKDLTADDVEAEEGSDSDAASKTEVAVGEALLAAAHIPIAEEPIKVDPLPVAAPLKADLPKPAQRQEIQPGLLPPDTPNAPNTVNAPGTPRKPEPPEALGDNQDLDSIPF